MGAKRIARELGIELGLGAGRGFSDYQLAMTPRVRIGGDRWAFLVGAGVSVGSFSSEDHFWFNTEVGVQYTGASGLFARTTVGARILTDSDDSALDLTGMMLPYAGVTVGKGSDDDVLACFAIFRALPWVWPSGFVSRVLTTSASASSSVILRGPPTRGSSYSPGDP